MLKLPGLTHLPDITKGQHIVIHVWEWANVLEGGIADVHGGGAAKVFKGGIANVFPGGQAYILKGGIGKVYENGAWVVKGYLAPARKGGG